MKILLVAATPPETAQICKQLGIEMQQSFIGSAHFDSYDIDLLHTGIGMVNTAFHLGSYLAGNQPDIAINLGIAGSFSRSIPLGEVVEVRTDIFSELGAQDGENFLTLEDMGFPLMQVEGQAQYNRLLNPHTSPFDIPQVSGITVNTVHGHLPLIEQVQEKWPVEVETMEGAAFFHAMLHKGIPFYAIRSISNYMERRDKSKWEIPLALNKVQDYVFRMLKESIL